MTWKLRFRTATAIWLLGLSLAASNSRASDRVPLDRAVIVVDSNQPSPVQYGVEDLAGYLQESTGNEILVTAAPDGEKAVQILVGAEAVGQVFPQNTPDAKPEDETYLLKVARKGDTTYVIVAGATPRGTKAALAVLMKTIRVEDKSVFLPAALNLAGKPAFAKRGMHLNGWAVNYPYSFRSWREEDWHSYLDILSYQGVNLFYLWPFIEIMPVPLSPEDRAYLEECRRVVDYAQKKHGMEVWIMQCTNRVAKDRCGVADPRLRPYWRPSQEDLNPGNPEHFQAIMASREALYSIVDNADGVCNIDSDPGFYPGSSLSDYVKVLEGCRALIDRRCIHGNKTKLVNWMLWGWGRAERFQVKELDRHQLLTLQSLKQALPEPWWLICCQFGFLPPGEFQFLPICREEGVLEKTVFLPYGIIEGEPSYPRTNVQIDEIRGTFDHQVAQFPALVGVMGNAQTPLLQFPNMYFFTSAMQDLDYRKNSEKQVLQDLSGHLYPEHQQLIADCFLALKEPDPAKIETLANRLDGVVRENRLGRLGVFGRKLFPDHCIVANSLVLQLRLRATYEKCVRGIAPTASKAECAKLLCDCLDAYLAWDTAHGWHALWGWQEWPLAAFPYAVLADGLRRNLGSESEVDAFFARVAQTLVAKHDAKIVQDGCIAPLRKAVLAAASGESEVH